MKRKLSIRLLLLSLIMAFGTICLTSCSNEDRPDSDGYILGSEVYIFKYEKEYTYLREIISDPNSHGSDKEDDGHISSEYPDYFTKSYITNLGDTIRILPKISVIPDNESEIDQIISKFGDKLSYKKKIGRAFIYNCPVKNSDELLKITTKLSKDKRVIGVEAIAEVHLVLDDTDPLYQ